MTLADIESAVGGRLRNVADPAVVVTDVVVDSREVTPGALFVALPGTRTDGLSFVDDAMSAGAAAALVAADGNTPSIVVDGELVEALPADGLAALNADDARVLAMRERTKARVRTFGRNADADVRAHDVTLDDKGRAGFTLSADGGTAHLQLQLYGEHQVTNA